MTAPETGKTAAKTASERPADIGRKDSRRVSAGSPAASGTGSKSGYRSGMSLLAACPDEGNAGPVPATVSPAGAGALAAAEPAPLVDPAALQELGEQVNSVALAKGFARDFSQMWEQRYGSLAGALDRREQGAALDAVLSLKTSSSMVGGLRLAGLAGELEEAIRRGDLEHAASRLPEVAARGGETVAELEFSYVLWDG